MPLKQSHKGRCLFASMQIGKWISAAVWGASASGWSTLRHSDCATEIQLRRGRLHLKRGLQGAHRHLHDSLRWYLLLSLPVRLFFQFVFKVQYISTHHTMKRWSWCRLQLLLHALWLWPTSNREHPCCLPFDFDSYSTLAYYRVYSFGICRVINGSVFQPFFVILPVNSAFRFKSL